MTEISGVCQAHSILQLPSQALRRLAMSTCQVHASMSPLPNLPKKPDHGEEDKHSVHVAIPDPAFEEPEKKETNYMARAQWLRAAVLGANDGLVSVASLMIGVGAVNQTSKAMLVSGLAGLVAGACSMAIGEFVSVYAQYDIEVAQMQRDKNGEKSDVSDEEKRDLPSPSRAAAASALAFSVGALLPLLAGGFIKAWGARIAAVCAVTSAGLAGFGATGAVLGGAKVAKSSLRVLLGGWMAMLISYGVLRLFGLAFGTQVSSS